MPCLWKHVMQTDRNYPVITAKYLKIPDKSQWIAGEVCYPRRGDSKHRLKAFLINTDAGRIGNDNIRAILYLCEIITGVTKKELDIGDVVVLDPVS